MKIIFLDIDGVLNVIPQGRDEYGATFHQHFIDNLKLIIDQTDAKIVVSSSWRKSSLKIMKEMWAYRNLPGEVIDVTPSLYLQRGGSIQFWNDKLDEHPTPKISGYSIPRGCEIEYWLKDKGFYHIYWDLEKQKEIIKKSGIQSYVIIDDDSDMLYNQRDNFVKTSGNIDHEDCIDVGYGLTDRCTELAICILNGI